MTLPHVEEAARSVPRTGDYDVIVCGSGPAGSAAAITAARAGARTLLLEAAGCLGGVWTSGLLTWILDGQQKTGIMREIFQRISGLSAAEDPGGSRSFDPEAMKVLLETMCLEAGVTIRLHTRVCAGLTDDAGRIQAIFTESKSGREAWAAQVFVDCTGDGDLAARLGATTELGHPETGLMQPMSMLCLLAGTPSLDDKPYTIPRYDPRVSWLREEIRRGGHEPSYANPSMFGIRDGLATLMANHQYTVDGTNADDLTRATLEARREVHAIINALKKAGPRWENLQLVATPAQIGVRESRRIRGRYVLNKDDLIKGARFDDGICRVFFPVDVHSLDPKKSKSLGNEGVTSRPYDVPLRSLIAAEFDNLLMAGRCISGDFFAHASYRVTGNAVAMGEAVGLLGAVATREACPPYQVSWDTYAPKLATIRGGAIIAEPAEVT
ncbi:MAG: FAD-dependent oxidoreductase [Opitutales bacterium]